ncbi:uncharacterized protein LOC143904852 [Temnothorax americanus]|uniref:uncharacterized protein LOC143904852 n=1 Tax=Temnothorax americanus TaxID=1964332 RepID=UPI0040692665
MLKASLENLKRRPDDLWNDILVHIVAQKLDPVTRKAWNLKEGDKDDPPFYDDLCRFLDSCTRALENFSPSPSAKAAPKAATASRIHSATASANSQAKCPLCPAQHFINSCPTFSGKNPSQLRDIVKQHKRCFNCLSAKHSVQACPSKYSCRVCQQKHHSMLHVNTDSSSKLAEADAPDSSSTATPDPKCNVNSLSASHTTRHKPSVLLATAWVTVSVESGRSAVVRALLDQGSEMTFISENLAQTLRARRVRQPNSVSAVGSVHAETFTHITRVSLSPRQSLVPSLSTTALILKSLASYTPKQSMDLSSLSHLSDLQWADEDPTSLCPINIIIGADLYSDIILDGVRKGNPGLPLAQNSVLGWIITGPIDASSRDDRSNPSSVNRALPCISAHHLFNSPTLEAELRRFWEVEELPQNPTPAPKDVLCEEHFRATHYRDPDGRYVVRLPFKKGPPISIGEFRPRAEQMLKALTRRFRDKPAFEKEYREFLEEYERLGHMRLAAAPSDQTEQHVYIPHHGVIREGSSTTHLRVAFNASSVTSNGTSLNDHLHVGPKLQREITAIIMRWRQYRYVYSADIAKMYRQIRIDSRDVNYQHIVWIRSGLEPLVSFILLTITYGMICAPYLALRILEQLSLDEGQNFPLATLILCDNIYVDDVLFGADDTFRIRQARDQLVSLLRRGGFKLRKWASNSPSLLSDLAADHGLACHKQLAQDEQVKILGIGWNPATDMFKFRVLLSDVTPNSKRAILSAIAKLYDPLGWVTPVTITAKIFMQHLWRARIAWDDAIPETLRPKWRELYTRLSHLSSLQIPRWTGFRADNLRAKIHGFADASNIAYAAVVYLKVVSASGEITVTLLAGKSKVALLQPLSVPRLELSAALLLARLIHFIRESLDLACLPYHCWTDAKIVLAWLKQHPSRWKTL